MALPLPRLLPAFALFLALVLNQRMLRAVGFFRTAFFAPVVTTLVAVALIWRYLLHTRYGLVNAVTHFSQDVDDYDRELIKKHEKTRKDKEDDRTKLIDTLSADTGPRCSCGQRGCWETYVSKRAIVARYLGKDASWPESADLRDVSLEEIIERARGGDRRALDALSETGRHLGRGFATIIKTIDPRRIYLGGEITAAWDLVAPMVEQALQADALIRDVGDTEILIVGLGEQARLRGAAALVSTPAFAAPVVS